MNSVAGLRQRWAAAFDAPAVGAPAVFLGCLLRTLVLGACYGASYEAANSLLEFGDRLLLTRLPLLMRLLGQSLVWGLLFGAVVGVLLGTGQGALLALVTGSAPRWRRPATLRRTDLAVVALVLAVGGYGLLAFGWTPLRSSLWPAAMLPLPLAVVGAVGCLGVAGALPQAGFGQMRLLAVLAGGAASVLVRLWVLLRSTGFDLRLFGG